MLTKLPWETHLPYGQIVSAWCGFDDILLIPKPDNMLGSDAVPSLLNNQVIGVFTANTADGSKAFYNTLATINVVQTLSYGKVLTANRNVTALFYVSQRHANLYLC